MVWWCTISAARTAVCAPLNSDAHIAWQAGTPVAQAHHLPVRLCELQKDPEVAQETEGSIATDSCKGKDLDLKHLVSLSETNPAAMNCILPWWEQWSCCDIHP